MKKNLILLSVILFLTGCYWSTSLLGPASGIANGKVAQSAISTSVNYAVKSQTGKFPIEHAADYADKKNKKEIKKVNCVSFLEKTSKEFCKVIEDRYVKIKASINKHSKIKRLD